MVRGLAVVTLLAAGSLAGCTGSNSASKVVSGPSASGRAAQPVGSNSGSTAGTTAPGGTAINPFTGGRPSKNPVVAVKIEDTAAGRPQVGVDQADIVYVEQVEGGLTRLLAIFNSRLPVVEPVRSTRANDPELAMEFGHVIYVASGGDHAELAPLRRSPLRADINDKGGPGFQRDPNRPIPNNLRANLAAIAKAIKGPGARSIGLTWSSTISNSHTAPGRTVRTIVGNTPVAFNWNPKLHRYVRMINGAVDHTANGHPISTPNVIVQFCRSTVYWRDRDVLGNPAQYTHTVGSGKVIVYRDGHRIEGTWSRRSVNDGTTLRDGSGKPIALHPGGAWFVLVAKGARVSG